MRSISDTSRQRSLASRVVLAALALAAVATGAAAALLPGAPPSAEAPAYALTAKGRGEIELRTTAAGRPILTAPRLVPGDTVSGRVIIRNTGETATRLKLARRRLVEKAGLNGGRLATRLRVALTEITQRKPDRIRRLQIYHGRVSELRRLALKPLEAGAKRTYAFEVTMLDGGLPSSPETGDNAFQGASVGVDFVWLAAPKARS
jgi:hypothetical protein